MPHIKCWNLLLLCGWPRVDPRACGMSRLLVGATALAHASIAHSLSAVARSSNCSCLYFYEPKKKTEGFFQNQGWCWRRSTVTATAIKPAKRNGIESD